MKLFLVNTTTLVILIFFGSGEPGDFVTSGDFGESGESAYPGNSVDFGEDFDYSG